MTRYGSCLLAGVVVLLVGGCTIRAHDGPDAPTPSIGISPIGTGAPGIPSAGIPSPADSPADPAVPPKDTPGTHRPVEDPRTFRTAYAWGVPADPVRISHPVRPPIASPPAPSLPYLVEIHAADHPGERPAYSRISFYFRGGFPSYELGYVARVTAEGTGDTVPLPGNGFLQIRFIHAQAHDERGRPSVTESPRPALGFPSLRGYAFGGDFEGYLTYGLGLRVAPGSDQALRIRVLEVTRANGMYVIAFDVRHA